MSGGGRRFGRCRPGTRVGNDIARQRRPPPIRTRSHLPVGESRRRCRRQPQKRNRPSHRPFPDLRLGAGLYRRRRSPLSPVFGDLAGLPPVVLHSAGQDPISADTHQLETLFHDNSSGTTLEYFHNPRRWHVYHLQVGFLRDADDAVAHMGQHLARYAKHPSRRPRPGLTREDARLIMFDTHVDRRRKHARSAATPM